jgi:acyl-CoA oxidase
MDVTLDDPQLRGFLPLLYIAWADGQLQPDEIRTLRDKVHEQVWLTPGARATLVGWLDPEHPPTAVALANLLDTIRAAAPNMSEARRLDLTGLGMAIASYSGDELKARAALADLEDALGVVSEEAASSVVTGARPRENARPPVPAFHVAAVQALLDAPPGCDPGEPLAREAARAFLVQTDPRVFDLSRAEHRTQVRDWLFVIAKGEIAGLSFPGVTSDATSAGPFMAAFETLGFGDLSFFVKLGVQLGLFGGSIFHLGSDSQRRELLPRIARMELLGCFAMSELGHGSNVMELETEARFDAERDEFVIHTPSESARKEWIGNAASDGTMATVFAQLEVGGQRHGVHAFLMPIRDPDGTPCTGVRIGDCGPKMGLEGVDNGRLWFDHVRVPRTALLSRFADVSAEGEYTSPIPSASKRFFTMLSTLVAGRISVAAGCLSAAKVGVSIALRYGESRRQFGPEGELETRLLDYPAHQRRLLPRLAGLYAMHFALADVRARYIESGGQDAREVETRAAALKAFVTWQACDALREARECCGGQGFLQVSRVGPLMADTEVFKTFEGDNTVLMQLVAKGLLTDYKRQFADARFLGIVKDLSRRVATALKEKNPVIVRATNPDHLDDGGWHAAIFEARERSLLGSVAMRLKRRLDDGMGSHDALLETQNHLLALAHAHAERLVRDGFAAVVEAQPETEERRVLEKLLDLWTLWRLEQDAGWFLENGFFDARKVPALRQRVEALCAELRPHVCALVESFGIPDAVLAAPIAFGDPAHPA